MTTTTIDAYLRRADPAYPVVAQRVIDADAVAVAIGNGDITAAQVTA